MDLIIGVVIIVAIFASLNFILDAFAGSLSNAFGMMSEK
jgi:hypothetical protein